MPDVPGAPAGEGDFVSTPRGVGHVVSSQTNPQLNAWMTSEIQLANGSVVQLPWDAITVIRHLGAGAADNLHEGMSTNGEMAMPLFETEVSPFLGLGDEVSLRRFNASSTLGAGAGDDLRDFVAGPVGNPLLPVLVGAAVLVPRLAGPIAARAATFFRGAGPLGSRLGWGSLPSWLQTALVATGATLGIDILLDIPGAEIVPGSIFGSGDNLPVHATQGMPGAHVVGSWVANNVTFYRLANGRLAVQNKHGRWKVWKPKKPIVIMPTGAGDLRTLLRADAVLNRQAKRIASMLNRRVGSRARKAPKEQPTVVVVPESTRIVHN